MTEKALDFVMVDEYRGRFGYECPGGVVLWFAWSADRYVTDSGEAIGRTWKEAEARSREIALERVSKKKRRAA